MYEKQITIRIDEKEYESKIKPEPEKDIETHDHVRADIGIIKEMYLESKPVRDQLRIIEKIIERKIMVAELLDDGETPEVVKLLKLEADELNKFYNELKQGRLSSKTQSITDPETKKAAPKMKPLSKQNVNLKLQKIGSSVFFNRVIQVLAYFISLGLVFYGLALLTPGIDIKKTESLMFVNLIGICIASIIFGGIVKAIQTIIKIITQRKKEFKFKFIHAFWFWVVISSIFHLADFVQTLKSI